MVDLDIDMCPEYNDYNHAGYWTERDNNNSPGICFYFGTLAVWWGVIYKCITLYYYIYT